MGSNEAELTEELLDFFRDRVKVALKSEGLRHDLIDAVFALGEDNLMEIAARVRALAEFLGTDDGMNLLAAYRRAVNILTKEEKKERKTYDGAVDAARLSEKEEQHLFEALEKTEKPVKEALETRQMAEAMGHIAALRAPVDRFFEGVMVNTEDPEIRENRLFLLARIRSMMDALADFHQVEG